MYNVIKIIQSKFIICNKRIGTHFSGITFFVKIFFKHSRKRTTLFSLRIYQSFIYPRKTHSVAIGQRHSLKKKKKIPLVRAFNRPPLYLISERKRNIIIIRANPSYLHYGAHSPANIRAIRSDNEECECMRT